MSWFTENCPRLALARDKHELAWRERKADELKRARDLARLESLVAHRELQLIRAGSIGRGRYIDVRRRKYEQAQGMLARCQGERHEV